MANKFSWLLALRRAILPGTLGAAASAVGIVAGKLAGAADGQPVTFAPEEVEVLVTVAAAALTGAYPVVRNVAKNHPAAPYWLRLTADVLKVLIVTVAMAGLAVGCVTTRQTLPDGTVVETTKADAEQVAMVSGLVQQIWTEYRAYEASKPTDPPEEQAGKLEQIAQLVQLLRQVQTGTQVIAPVPAEVATGTAGP